MTAMIKSWRNGDRGETVKQIVEDNFKTISKYLSGNLLSLSTNERLALDSDHLRDGSIVYDIDDNLWYQYKNGAWNVYSFSNGYTKIFSTSDWSYSNTDKCYKINIPLTEHQSSAHFMNAYIYENGQYNPVCGGVCLLSDNTVSVRSNLAYNGKVEIW